MILVRNQLNYSVDEFRMLDLPQLGEMSGLLGQSKEEGKDQELFFFEKLIQEYHQSVNQFGSRSRQPVHHALGPICL